MRADTGTREARISLTAGPRGYLASAALRLEEVFSLPDFRTIPRQESFHIGLRHLDESTRPQLETLQPVYTVVLIASLEDDQDGDETTISEYSIFHRTQRPSAYTPKRWVGQESRED